MYTKKLFLGCVILTGFVSSVFSQNDAATMKTNLAPASPEAANLFKFEDIPVGKYTGTADVTIPLVNVTDKTTSYPISLSYHTSGNKLSDVASYTGLGWKLNAGGMISRKVRGLPDDGPGGKIHHNNWFTNVYSKVDIDNTINGWTTMLNLIGQRIDGEPDEFYFSFGSLSGKMAFRHVTAENPGEPLVVTCNSSVKVDYTMTNAGITEWRITTPEGLRYKFAAQERTRTTTYNLPITNPDLNCSTVLPWEEFTTSWFLTEITNVTGYNTSTITFTYDDYNTDFEWVITNTETHSAWAGESCGAPLPVPAGPLLQTGTSKSRVYIKGKKLREIFFSDSRTYVKFGYINARLDLPSTINDKSLDNIIVEMDVDGNPSNKRRLQMVELNYFYQGGRLMLRSVQQVENTGLKSVPPYTFSYNSTSLPGRPGGMQISNQGDHWGYYNYSNESSRTLPAYQELVVPGWNYYRRPGGSNKDPDFERTKAQVLEKIVYPTGGSTYFTYEQNSYSNIQEVSLRDKHLKLYGDTLHTVEVTGDMVRRYPRAPNRVSREFSLNDQATVSVNFIGEYAPCWFDPAADPDGDGVPVEGTPVFCGNSRFPTIELYQLAPNNVWVQVFKKTTNFETLTGQFTWVLLPGTYKMEATADNRYSSAAQGENRADYIKYELGYQYATAQEITEKKMGGLRIREVRDFDSIGGVAKTRRFDYSMPQGNSTITSGVIYGEPIYMYESYPVHTVATGSAFAQIPCLARTILGSSSIVLGETAGSPIGYRQVTEWEIYKGQPNGKIVAKYTSPALYTDFINEEKPFGAPESRSYKTGLLQSEEYFNTAGELLKKDSFEYVFKENEFLSVKVSKGLIECPCSSSPSPSPVVGSMCQEGKFYDVNQDGINDYFAASRLKLIHGISQISREIHMQDGFTVEKLYQYDNNLQLAKKIVVRNDAADADSVVMSYKHVGDEGSMTGLTEEELQAITGMKIIGMNTAVLEELKRKQNTDVVRMRTHFKGFATSGLSRPSVSGVSIQNFGGTLDKKYIVEAYNDFGKILQQRKLNDIPYSYVWDALSPYPTAEVSNALYTEVAFTSFEFENSTGSGWQIGQTAGFTRNATVKLTGRYGYDLSNGSITNSVALSTGKKYVVSYWSKNGAYNVNGISPVIGKTNGLGWTYYEHTTNTTTTLVTVSGTGTIDELRLYPLGAEMTTYTYEPGAGVSSKNTTDNIITFYEFDGMNRLKLVRDQDGNILQMHEYKFQEPGRSLVADWQDASPTELRCETGMDINANNNYATGYQLKKQVDANPYSATANQSRWVRNAQNIAACPVVPNWVNIGNECVRDGCGNFNGTYKTLERDNNPYSPTYNQTRLTGGGTNNGLCPPKPTCTTEGYAAVNNVCTLGQRISVGVERDGCFNIETYYYKWSCGITGPLLTKRTRVTGCTGN